MHKPSIVVDLKRVGHLHRLPARPFQSSAFNESIIVVIERLKDHRTTSQFETSTMPFTILARKNMGVMSSGRE